MDKLIIRGDRKLSGEVLISGSKNSALPIMAATLLTEERCVITNVPSLSDVHTMIKLLESLGKKIIFEQGRLIIDTVDSKKHVAHYKLVRTMRASFCVLGPLLGRLGKAKVSLPGGCVIGVRPVDLHIKGFMALGAKIKIKQGYCYAEADTLHGGEIFLGGAFGSSVLATGNVMMAAVLAKDRTIIDFAACEPEVVDLAECLNKMGAKITGAGTPRITIDPVKKLKGFTHNVIYDRIEAGTFLAFGIMTRSNITIKNVSPNHLLAVLDLFKTMNQEISSSKDSIKIKKIRNINPVDISTLPFPGFPTDLQAQFMALLCLAKGISVVTEKVYPDRFMHVPELNRMGAHIIRNGEIAIIKGNRVLQGAEVMASDLRASAALVGAGLSAKGKTTIHRIYHLDRGYDKIDMKLKKLGADVERKK